MFMFHVYFQHHKSVFISLEDKCTIWELLAIEVLAYLDSALVPYLWLS